MNVMGYYGLLVGLQYKNDLEWQRRIQAGQYLEDDAVLMKIPQAQVGQSLNDADAFDGIFEKEGSVYKLIRQRVHRDTFHIVAIKDQTGTFIKHAIAEYAETFSDNPSQQDPQPL